MPSLEAACQAMETACEVWSLGYDQYERANIYDGGECDCSSLVIWCLQQGGFDTGNASYTGNMSSELCARGWSRINPDGYPERGTILLNDTDHVALALGSGLLGQASIDENGNIYGGEAGDQSGWETNIRSYYDYPWDCYLVYDGEDDTGDGSSSTVSSLVAPVKYAVAGANHKFYGELENLSSPEGDGFAGETGEEIYYLKMDFPGWYQVKTRNGWLGKNEEGDGTPILGIKCYYETESPSRTGYHSIFYRCSLVNESWLSWVEDDVSPEGDGYSGDDAPIDRFQAYVGVSTY